MNTFTEKPKWDKAFKGATHLGTNRDSNGKGYYVFAQFNGTNFHNENGVIIPMFTIVEEGMPYEPSLTIIDDGDLVRRDNITIEGKPPFEGATHVLRAAHGVNYPPFIFAKRRGEIMVGEFDKQLPANIYKYHQTLTFDDFNNVPAPRFIIFTSKPTWDMAFKNANCIVEMNDLVRGQKVYQFATETDGNFINAFGHGIYNLTVIDNGEVIEALKDITKCSDLIKNEGADTVILNWIEENLLELYTVGTPEGDVTEVKYLIDDNAHSKTGEKGDDLRSIITSIINAPNYGIGGNLYEMKSQGYIGYIVGLDVDDGCTGYMNLLNEEGDDISDNYVLVDLSCLTKYEGKLNE